MSHKARNKVIPFASGCIVTAGILLSQGAIGTSGIEPKTEQIIQQTVSDTARAVIMGLKAEENERLEKIPDPLNCNSFSWMESCEEINRQAKLNPQAPIRVRRADGLEFNFPPGTPSPVMNAMLDDRPEATRAMIDHLDSLIGHHSRLAKQYTTLLWAQGGLKNAEISADRSSSLIEAPRKTIDVNNVALRIFYDSRCAACKVTLRNIKTLRERYPKIEISAFQFDSSEKALEQTKEYYGIDARILSDAEKRKLQNSGMNTVPTMWIDNPREKHRLQREGTVSLTVLEDELERVSNFKMEGQG